MSLMVYQFDRFILFVATVTMYHILEDLFFSSHFKAPLDANEAAHFSCTAWAFLSAQMKQCHTAFLQREQT